MIETWATAVDFVLRMEGGYDNDPNDPGGETNWGICKRSYPSLDIKALTRDDAVAIYRRDFWTPCQCDQLPTGLDVAVFDTAVNQGQVKAVRLLQEAIGTNVDGHAGPRTVFTALQARDGIINKFLVIRLREYAVTMTKNPKLLVFAENWFHRVLSLRDVVGSLGSGER